MYLDSGLPLSVQAEKVQASSLDSDPKFRSGISLYGVIEFGGPMDIVSNCACKRQIFTYFQLYWVS